VQPNNPQANGRFGALTIRLVRQSKRCRAFTYQGLIKITAPAYHKVVAYGAMDEEMAEFDCACAGGDNAVRCYRCSVGNLLDWAQQD
jgi:hypothetical protein